MQARWVVAWSYWKQVGKVGSGVGCFFADDTALVADSKVSECVRGGS